MPAPARRRQHGLEDGTTREIVVELDDWDFDISLPGPVKHLLRSGADAYVLADSIAGVLVAVVGLFRFIR